MVADYNSLDPAPGYLLLSSSGRLVAERKKSAAAIFTYTCAGFPENN